MQFTVAKHTRVMKEIAKSNSRYLKEVYGFMWVSSAVLGSGSCRMDTSVRRVISDQLSAVSHVIKTSGDCGMLSPIDHYPFLPASIASPFS